MSWCPQTRSSVPGRHLVPLEHQDLVLSPEAPGGGCRWSTYSMQALSQAAQQPWVRTGTRSMTSSPEDLLELPEGGIVTCPGGRLGGFQLAGIRKNNHHHYNSSLSSC